MYSLSYLKDIHVLDQLNRAQPTFNQAVKTSFGQIQLEATAKQVSSLLSLSLSHAHSFALRRARARAQTTRLFIDAPSLGLRPVFYDSLSHPLD